jgi:hypothetical protein
MKTLCPEMDRWLEQRMTRVDVAPAPLKARKNAEPVPACPLDDKEFAWLWPHYQACSFPPASAAKRLAKTPLPNLTLRGRNFGVLMAFKFRRQILGKWAAKLGREEFLAEVRKAAAS